MSDLELESGRAAYQRRAWSDAYRSLAHADGMTPLAGADLERLAVAAYLIGRDEEFLEILDRAHRLYAAQGDRAGAARCTFWLGIRLFFRGELGRATGWFARGQRFLEREGDCAESGYFLLPLAYQSLTARDWPTAQATAARAAEIGERFGEPALLACARNLEGRARVRQGCVAEGLALLDASMIPAIAGELSPLMTGFLYYSSIEGCHQIWALGRAREWTAALARWCGEQPDMLAFTNLSMVRRAEILYLHGAWPDALELTRRACAGCAQTARAHAAAAAYKEGGVHPRGTGSENARRRAAAAFYQQAEIHRLRGEFAAAEESYRSVSRQGRDPQPGLALLRAAEGQAEVAAAALRRALDATSDPLERASLLPAYVEILLAAGEAQRARDASRELDAIANKFPSEGLSAIAAHARGAVELAEGDAQGALGSLRHAGQFWQQLGAPYAAARVRELTALACRALGDHDGYALELAAARTSFEVLGAAPDLARIDSHAGGAPVARDGLTRRELQVLRLVSSGRTNKAIAAELFLSEKTIDRHVSNILGKLELPSRAAATAYAYKHRLL